MTEPTPERTPEQAKAVLALFTAAVSVKRAALAFMVAMSRLRDAVAMAYTAGISRSDVFGIVREACNRNIPADVLASLRQMLRRTYNP
jgi:hypothetical protein